jgi:hypothetical protein
MKQDLIEIESFCQNNDCCFGCPYEDECFDCYLLFGFMHAKDWMQHFTEIIYADGE